MPVYKAQVSFPALNGVGADLTINTFYVDTGVSVMDEAIATFWATLLVDFYESFDSIGGMFGYDMELGRAKIYDVATPEPNYPLFERALVCDNTSIPFQLPPEVALCVSYHNDSEIAVPRGRRRGRIYISGWGTSNNSADGRPSSTTYNGLLTAYTGYVNAVNGGLGVACIWSQVGGQAHEIERITVDNEWDTQRRRGRKATLTVSALKS